MHASTLPWHGRDARASAPGSRPAARAWRYFASDTRRGFQSVLGLMWLLDGCLQFQPYMYSRQFSDALAANASGQPRWLAASITWAAHLIGQQPVLFNTLFALTQVAIGLALLCRRTVRPALAVSLGWSVLVWWFGEGLGMLLAGSADPLTGAPGAVLIYAVIGLAVWPSRRPGGLLGVAGVRLSWAVLWLAQAALWLLPANSSVDATHETLMMTPAGMTAPAGMRWLSRLEGSASMAAQGHGLAIALVLALVSVVVGITVAINWHPTPVIAVAIAISLVYWVIGQSFGGLFYTPSATDPNSGPLLVLLALVVYSLTPVALGARTSSDPPGARRARMGSAPRAAARRARPAAMFGSLATLCIVAVVGAALLDGPTKPPVQPIVSGSPFEGQTLSPPTVAPPVALHDQRGRAVSLSQYPSEGKAVLLTFLASQCPGACPLAAELRQSLAAMPASERARVQLVAISLDPRNDTAARVAAFLRRYHLSAGLEYLIGSRRQLSPVWTEWNVDAVRAGMTSIYGISASGAAVTSYSAFFTPQELVHDVKRLETL